LDVAGERRYRDGRQYREDDDDDDELDEREAPIAGRVCGAAGTGARRGALAPCGRLRARKSRSLAARGVGRAGGRAKAAAVKKGS
jgi:hypothetical protein